MEDLVYGLFEEYTCDGTHEKLMRVFSKESLAEKARQEALKSGSLFSVYYVKPILIDEQFYKFKPVSVNIIKRSKFNEGDKQEHLEADIEVYKNDVSTGLVIHAQIKDNKYCFTWKTFNKIHVFECLRNGVFEVIKQCEKNIPEDKRKKINYLNGIAHYVMISVIKEED
jgi:ribosomal protein S26